MDLSQTKVSKTEWTSMEVSVSDQERKVLNLIVDGYANPELRHNETTSILSILKIQESAEMELYLFKQFFEPVISGWVQSSKPASTSKKTTLSVAVSSKPSVSAKWQSIIQTWLQSAKSQSHKVKQPNSKDMIRVQNTTLMVETHRNTIFEFALLEYVYQIASRENTCDAGYHVYGLIQLMKFSVAKVNGWVKSLVETVILPNCGLDTPDMVLSVFANASECIENTSEISKYEDMELFPHQKKLFSIFHRKGAKYIPKLVLYMAPTGTGKTLSPLGLSQEYRVIFVCVARHVGLALAKSAISVGKRVAFALGCQTASDIRLHYFAAAEYKINKKSGGIGKVDNGNGSKVEMMICDVASYLTAMHYMLAFHTETDIITYWDEPTITMDYSNHELHDIIHRNWEQNKISKMVLSCATLPKPTEIQPTIQDFQNKFSICEDDVVIEPEVHVIDSYDCNKSISLLNKDGVVSMPHMLFSNYADVLRCASHCLANKTLLRYFDVAELVRFISYVCANDYVLPSLQIENMFKHVDDMSVKVLKHYYLEILMSVYPEHWPKIHQHMVSTAQSKLFVKKETSSSSLDFRKVKSQDFISHTPLSTGGGELRRMHSVAVSTEKPEKIYTSGVLVSTSDAYTLTHGPTIFIAEDVDKIGLFYIQQANIPDTVLQTVLSKIEKNNVLQAQMDILEEQMEEKMNAETGGNAGGDDKTKKACRNMENDRSLVLWKDQLDALKSQIEYVSLNPKYIPNTIQHRDTWIPFGYEPPMPGFVGNVDQTDVKTIMGLNVSSQKKLLLIMGIGVFSQDNPSGYTEIMKKLAQEKRLFLIIASSDYVYGTNYQFSHGFLGKDIEQMTQQKIIQALGRVGRAGTTYLTTIRFRDNAMFSRLFLPQTTNMEAINMSRLFCSNGDV